MATRAAVAATTLRSVPATRDVVAGAATIRRVPAWSGVRARVATTPVGALTSRCGAGPRPAAAGIRTPGTPVGLAAPLS
jgi:hypothetical protein